MLWTKTMLPGLSVYAEDRAQRRAKIPEWAEAAKSGDVKAQLKLAWEYARGDAIDQDIVKAQNLFDRAAESGEEEALVNRARFLQLRRVPMGMLELRRLSAKGNWKAQFWIAQYYQAHADRVSQLKAMVWYDRSLRNGGGTAAELGKQRQRVKVAPLWLKPFFIGKAIAGAFPFVWRATWKSDDNEIRLFESLLYQLKNKHG